jgi:phenylacetate-CoA ligase
MLATLWNPKAENMNRDELRSLQFDKLKTLVEKVDRESPYYHTKLRDAGVTPKDLKSLEHYQDFPFFDKDEERKSQELSKETLGHPFGMHITCKTSQSRFLLVRNNRLTDFQWFYSDRPRNRGRKYRSRS